MKDVQQYNEEFLKIILVIPHINMEENVDSNTRFSKSYIWNELCTKEYAVVTGAMKDTERVE